MRTIGILGFAVIAALSLLAIAFSGSSVVLGQTDCIDDPNHWKLPNQPSNSDCLKCHTTCTPGGPGLEHDFCSEGGTWNRTESACINCHKDIHWTISPGVCNDCHGNDDNAAPPVSSSGESDTRLITVGAHQSHLKDSRIRLAISCTNCHTVPRNTEDPGHVDNPPAEVRFSGLATLHGSVPKWNRSAGTCANVYCHGATLPGGSNKAPVWTVVNGSQVACGSCHGNPPRDSHHEEEDGNKNCHECHPRTVKADGTIDVMRGYHIDGTVQHTDD